MESFKHHVTSGTVNHRLLVEPQPLSLVFDIGRELRICIICVCLAWTTVSLARNWNTTSIIDKKDSTSSSP